MDTAYFPRRVSPSMKETRKETNMSFVIGVILFVGVVGFLDARLPWGPS